MVTECSMLSLHVFGKGVKTTDDVLSATVASACVGIVGAAFGIVGGWLIDTFIHVVRRAGGDYSRERPDRGRHIGHLRRDEAEI
jgi:hypothetical protein